MDLTVILRPGRIDDCCAHTGEPALKAERPLLVATLNPGKLRELRDLLGDLPLILLSLDDFPAIQPVLETGETFTENASLKAIGYARQTSMLTIADDSGLEVDALNGAPGVFSARYAEEEASDAARTAKLLAELSNIEGKGRSARFVSVIAISDSRGSILNLSKGICEGQISLAPRGNNGFGYDPVFLPQGYDSTFAELPAAVKNRLSHRAQALRDARDYLRALTGPSGGR
jgi:XTP/dITP diphosphohydrolase